MRDRETESSGVAYVSSSRHGKCCRPRRLGQQSCYSIVKQLGASQFKRNFGRCLRVGSPSGRARHSPTTCVNSVVTFILLYDDNTPHRRTYRAVRTGNRTRQLLAFACPGRRGHYEAILGIDSPSLLVGTGCGGYGSGMGTTPAATPSICTVQRYVPAPLNVTISDSWRTP